MVEPRHSGGAGTFNCPSCGALYEVHVLGRLLEKEKGAVTCELCGVAMVEWTTASVPSFRLIERPNRTKREKVSRARA